jgi:hypothetical protein
MCHFREGKKCVQGSPQGEAAMEISCDQMMAYQEHPGFK